MSIFEKATKLKLRFTTLKGLLTTEDLWDLPLSGGAGKANLDGIAIELFNQLNEGKAISFVGGGKAVDEIPQLKFDIVKHIIDVKVAERAVRTEAAARSEKKQLILGIIAQKENEALASTSLEDLRKLAADLQG